MQIISLKVSAQSFQPLSKLNSLKYLNDFNLIFCILSNTFDAFRYNFSGRRESFFTSLEQFVLIETF